MPRCDFYKLGCISPGHPVKGKPFHFLCEEHQRAALLYMIFGAGKPRRPHWGGIPDDQVRRKLALSVVTPEEIQQQKAETKELMAFATRRKAHARKLKKYKQVVKEICQEWAAQKAAARERARPWREYIAADSTQV